MCDIELKLVHHLQKQKSAILIAFEYIERMLIKTDLKFTKERHLLIASKVHHDHQIAEKECNIKDMLNEIAMKEMNRIMLDEQLADVTLKTIEIINISDLHLE